MAQTFRKQESTGDRWLRVPEQEPADQAGEEPGEEAEGEPGAGVDAVDGDPVAEPVGEPVDALARMDAFARRVGFDPDRLPAWLTGRGRLADVPAYRFDWSRLLPPLTMNLHQWVGDLVHHPGDPWDPGGGDPGGGGGDPGSSATPGLV